MLSPQRESLNPKPAEEARNPITSQPEYQVDGWGGGGEGWQDRGIAPWGLGFRVEGLGFRV